MATSSTSKKLTPMMEQYRSIKKTLPSNTILFFRLGDFYEMFFEDAIRAAEILDITLTGRGNAEGGSRIPMCGIPYHASQGYIKTLIEANLKVAVCEQVGDPKATKGLVERKVKRIISPATYLDDEGSKKSAEYMVAVVRDSSQKKISWDTPSALAYLDMSTGEFHVREVPEDRLVSEILLLNPREVIFPKSLSEDTKLSSFVKESLNATVTCYEDWIFERDEAMRLLVENFNLASERGISFYQNSLAVSAAGGILYYLRDHLHKTLSHIGLPTLLQATDFMVIDRQTQNSLELVKTQQGKSGTRSTPTLLSCMDQTLTSMGARTLHGWLIRPLLKPEQIQNRQDAVSEFYAASETLYGVRELFEGVKDLERTLTRLNYGVANARDLINLKNFLERVPNIKKTLKTLKSAELAKYRDQLNAFENLQSLIAKSIVPEPPLTIREGGIIQESYSEELDELREISGKGKQWLLEFEKREAEKTGIKALKLKYSGVFGYTIEVRKGSLNLVPEHYQRRQTLANAERFIVPELKEWDEKISGAQDKIKALEYQLFDEIRQKILKELAPLQSMARAVGVLDAISSLAMTALQKGWVKPKISDSGKLEIEAGRHPVVESMLPSGEFVENDVTLNEAGEQLVILTGPNMAGKSTYIRQVAQIVLLAQIGSFVPAKSAKVGVVDRIFTRIGASDDLAHGESTFMVEMLETAHILQSATSKSLIILDEVGRGTSTFDGVSIAWAICEHLVKGSVKPRTLFATHYHELTQLEDHFEGIKNYNIAVKETKGGIVFLRKVVPGKTDRSYGIHVARLAGIPDSVTKRADEILEILESENTEATEIIEGKSTKKATKKKVEDQPTFFDLPTEEDPLIGEIKELDLNGLTPLEALNKISEWKERLV